MKKIRIRPASLNYVLMALACFVLSGCFRKECTQYNTFVSDSTKQTNLLDWADATVFAAKPGDLELKTIGIPGPGRSKIASIDGKNLELPHELATMPFWIEGRPLEIRLLGEDENGATAIFIGRKAFKGLVISRTDIQSVLHSVSQNVDRDFPVVGERVAVLCYFD